MTPRRTLTTLAIALTATSLAACQRAAEEPAEAPADTARAAAEPGDVQVIAVDYAFRAPAEIPSGWTTIRMTNEGQEEHFMVLWKPPEGRSLQDYGEIVSTFVTAYDSLEAGTVDVAGANRILGERLPEWFAEVLPVGGTGLLSPGRDGQVTVKLEPGTYILECYVKNAEGRFHSELGMLKELVVTADSTGAAPPDAHYEMTLTNTSIGAEGPIPAGEHTFAVHYEEHPEMGLGNDVHVARLSEDTDLAEVADWMDWMNLDGFRAPAPVEFVGGVQEMPVGSTSYFTVDLTPGRYAWVSEATTTDRQVREFTVE